MESWRLTLCLITASFFYVSWLFGGEGEQFSAETVYFAVLFGFTSLVFFLELLQADRPPHTTWLLVHLTLIFVAVTTILWAPSKTTGAREAIALVYGYMFHFLGRSIPVQQHVAAVAWMYKTIITMLILTYIFVGIGFVSGDIPFSFEDDEPISDVEGYFVVPIDLLSILVIGLVTALLVGIRVRGGYVVIVLASTMLFLNFSKTYLVATALALACAYAVVGRGVRTKLFASIALTIGGAALVLTDNPFARQLVWDTGVFQDAVLSDPELALQLVNASGRFTIWEYLLEKSGNGVGGHVIGSGLGSSKYLLYSNPWGGAGLASHSDYVRLVADFGYLGVATYLALLIGTMAYLWRYVLQEREVFGRWLGLFLLSLLAYVSVGGLGYEFLNRVRTTYLIIPFLFGVHWHYRKTRAAESPPRQQTSFESPASVPRQ